MPLPSLKSLFASFVGLSVLLANGARAQSCKWEAPQMCSHWHWDEVNGGTPISLLCPSGNVNCIPIIKGDMKVNGYKLWGVGWDALVTASPSPGRIEVFVPIGCTCAVGGFDCVCMYPPVSTKIACPNLANPGHTMNCP